MYGGYAWLTNAVELDRASRRLLLLAGMASYLVLALAIPHAFAGSGLAFGLAYLAIVLVHATLFTRSSSGSVVRGIARVGPVNVGTALLVLLGGALGGTPEYVLLAVAGTARWLSPQLTSLRGFAIGPAHFVERHGLVVLIAIGESVVAVGIGAEHLTIDLRLVVVAVLGLALSACLWWAYFGGDDRRAERALEAAPAEARPGLALTSFGYCHLLILLGIVAVASTLREATGHAFHELGTARALALAGGVTAFLVGDALFRRTLRIGQMRWRLVAAVVVLATIPLGTAGSAALQLAAVVAVLLACFAREGAARDLSGA
jgi:low temperature requirement protein LtrA